MEPFPRDEALALIRRIPAYGMLAVQLGRDPALTRSRRGALVVAAAYLAVATEQYKAEDDLLVIPASREDTALNGLPVIRESSDPTRDVETAARLVDNRNVAKAVKEDLGLDQSVDSLLSQVTAEPVAQSNIVAVTATTCRPWRYWWPM